MNVSTVTQNYVLWQTVIQSLNIPMIEVEMHIKNVTQFCQIQIQNNELLGMVIYWGNYSDTCILYVTCQSRICYNLIQTTVNYYNNVPLLAISNKNV